jgi:hypothetical protein
MKFRSDVAGWVYSIRFYKSASNTGTHVANLWNSTGTQLATGSFTGETASGWQQFVLATPVAVTANTTYVVSYFAPNGHYAAEGAGLATAVVNAPLTGLANGTDGTNGVYRAGSTGFPTSSFNAANYWVDVTFSTTPPPDVTGPAVVARSPLGGATSVSTATTVTATFDEDVQPGSISFGLTGPGNVAVPATTSYTAGTRTVSLVPNAALANATSYTATVSGVLDTAGNSIAAPVTWSFQSATAPPTVGVCPCSLWHDGVAPATASAADGGAIELGVRFTPASDGTVSGIKFYKGPSNTGTHTATLWSGGVALATATFSGESTTGWQTVTFSSPVAVTAGTVYTASYYAPNGGYSYNSGYFPSAYTTGPLTALAASNGGNAVYRYGLGGVEPTSSGAGANYWVDVIFSP